MDSTVETPVDSERAERPRQEKLGSRMMPYMAILRHDLRSLWQSWLVRLWLGATALLTFMLVGANWTQFRDGTLIASFLFTYLVFPWVFVVVVLGVSPVSGSRAETLADGILSRPVSRCEYLLATWSARVVLVLGVYLIVTLPAVVLVMLAKRPVPEDRVTVYGIFAALFVVGLVLTFLVSLGFLMGTLLRKPLLAVVVLVFLWYPIGLILSIFSLEEFSPISLSRAISTQLRQSWMEPDANLENQTNAEEVDAVTDQMSHFFSVFSGIQPKPKAANPDFFEGGQFEDFSLLRVILGYGLPTLAAVFLAGLCFYWRDL
jgi:ABC-type transport system involved in multi-copper enzyme maturation permease subunit